ncbi:MAG: MCE family protein [Verrucomicrobia bacterium]|nr:MCE family protein [Verrucomicrobiota bacterium]MCH8512033.1 MlaD family protein [Kiritimatiellia bacterium]
MKHKANPTLVGLFVVGAVALAFAGLLMLGGGRYFEPSEAFVLYFEGNLNGLDVGAPVTSRGVRIGEVQKISLVYDHRMEELSTPVEIRIYRNSFVELDGGGAVPRDIQIAGLVEKGLRARLEFMTFVTGKMRVSLDFHPEVEAVYKGVQGELEEIPTIPTTLASFTQQIDDLPFEEIIADVHSSMNQIARFLESGTLEKTLDELNQSLNGLSQLMAGLEVDQTLEEIRESSRSFRMFIDYLNRHPEALLRGKGSRP